MTVLQEFLETGWNNPAVVKSEPPGYTPGSGTGFLPGEEFPA